MNCIASQQKQRCTFLQQGAWVVGTMAIFHAGHGAPAPWSCCTGCTLEVTLFFGARYSSLGACI